MFASTKSTPRALIWCIVQYGKVFHITPSKDIYVRFKQSQNE